MNIFVPPREIPITILRKDSGFQTTILIGNGDEYEYMMSILNKVKSEGERYIMTQDEYNNIIDIFYEKFPF